MGLSAVELARVALLRPPLRQIVPALADRVEQMVGKKVTIAPRGAVRSHQDQIDLWNDRANNPYPVAVPGESRHEYGGAVDLSIIGGTDADYAEMGAIAENEFGLIWEGPGDRVHVHLYETIEQAKAAWAAATSKRWLWIGGGIAAVVVAWYLSQEGE